MIVEVNDIRIDKYVTEHTNYSRNLVLNLLKSGNILVNDKIVKLIVQVVVVILNYVLSKFIVFKKK